MSLTPEPGRAVARPGSSAPRQLTHSLLVGQGREESSDPPTALGVYQHGAPWDMAPLDAFERLAERPVDIVMWYQDWATTRKIEVAMIERVGNHGALPMLTWEPWDHTRESGAVTVNASLPPWWRRFRGS